MPNGDIVSGSSDGIIRVFSSAEERWVSQAEIQEYDAKVASQALPSQVVGDVKKSDLPGPEALTAPGPSYISETVQHRDVQYDLLGRKDGDVKMVTNGDIVEAHQVR